MRFWTSVGLVITTVLVASCAGEATTVPAHPVGSANKLFGDAPGDPAHNLLGQSSFDDGVMLPWMSSLGGGAEGEASVKDGALCLHIEKPGVERWDAQLRHRDMIVQKGRSYTLSFKAWASRPTKMTGKVGMSGPPYLDYWSRPINLTTEPQQFNYEFHMAREDDPTVELAFHAGGRMVQGDGPIDLCFDDLILSDPEFTPPPAAGAVVVPAVRVNQLGYLPSYPKVATVITDATAAQPWKLLDAAGTAVAEGQTTPHGPDATSGDAVQVVDFSAFNTSGKGYVLEVLGNKSDSFDIDKNLYEELKNDAFKYFYHNRSGVEIKMPFAGGEQWARPAGHPKDVVTCAPADVLKAAGWYDGGACTYQLDVTGGWYDAGDHGKYVVNGGISVWTLMNWYERVQHQGGDKTAFADDSGLLPESGNKVPDILDEARWQMEFMLRMQATEGEKAGMVHHKMHDREWTALGLPPHKDAIERFLRPVSTAATLNVAATAAQAARIFKTIDAAFSKRCLGAAEKAWKAANRFPALYAPEDSAGGGGPYNDDEVSDEFYWAAAELLITTGKGAYKKALTDSKHHGQAFATTEEKGGDFTAMTWGKVDVLGKVSLAVVPSSMPQTRAQYQKVIAGVADQYLAAIAKQGYRHPLRPGADGKYPWGSNSLVINNMLIMALAHDFTNDKKYRDGVSLGMDYVLGRNAMGRSYVTGYGERPLHNPHHRFWAKQVNPDFPAAPPGAVSGGPNSSIQDPYAKAAGLAGCAPQKCFVDHIESWSTNEITINWNAPFAWVTAWLDEHAE
jgi:endoglucanase